MNGTGKLTSEEVAEALRARIESDELAAGQPIPTQKSLVEAFGAQCGVIRRALRSLQEDGLLTEVTRGAPPRIADPLYDLATHAPVAAGGGAGEGGEFVRLGGRSPAAPRV
ncbi:GntR family transcriptional regulator [Streptomyces scopuliridis]|uniref:GntR family transcriptional regulator n=1 Tax=Streptomyces scopuliridis TaxID=452529 RepID=UPI0036CD73E8